VPEAGHLRVDDLEAPEGIQGLRVEMFEAGGGTCGPRDPESGSRS
jgi:hypothetical protein